MKLSELDAVQMMNDALNQIEVYKDTSVRVQSGKRAEAVKLGIELFKFGAEQTSFNKEYRALATVQASSNPSSSAQRCCQARQDIT